MRYSQCNESHRRCNFVHGTRFISCMVSSEDFQASSSGITSLSTTHGLGISRGHGCQITSPESDSIWKAISLSNKRLLGTSDGPSLPGSQAKRLRNSSASLAATLRPTAISHSEDTLMWQATHVCHFLTAAHQLVWTMQHKCVSHGRHAIICIAASRSARV